MPCHLAPILEFLLLPPQAFSIPLSKPDHVTTSHLLASFKDFSSTAGFPLIEVTIVYFPVGGEQSPVNVGLLLFSFRKFPRNHRFPLFMVRISAKLRFPQPSDNPGIHFDC